MDDEKERANKGAGASSRPATQCVSRGLRRRALVVERHERYHGGAAVAQLGSLDQNHRLHTTVKTRIALTALTLLVVLTGVQPVNAIEDLRLQIQGTNAVLSWPSTANETFIVRYRARLDEGHPWTILTNDYPAAVGTNRTALTHVGVVEYPTGGGGGGGGGGNPPPPEGGFTGQDDSDTDKIEWPPLPPMP